MMRRILMFEVWISSLTFYFVKCWN